MEKRFFLQAVCFFLVFSFSVPCFSQKSRGNEKDIAALNALAEIDDLITETDYNTALKKLNTYIDVYPDFFDEAQKRVTKILVARKMYAQVAEELINVIQTDPGNNERILEIIARLEALEKNPTASQLAFVRNARRAAQFNYFRAQLVEIQNRADAMYAQGDYVGAVDANHSGFYMYRDDFFFDYRDREEADIAGQALSLIEDSIERYKNLQPRFNDAYRAYIAAANNRDATAASLGFEDLVSACEEFAEIRNALFLGAGQLNALHARIGSEGGEDVTDASFLPFVTRYMSGRTGVANTGIAGIVDGQWAHVISELKTVSVKAAESLNNQFVANAGTSFVDASAYGTEQLDGANVFAKYGGEINNFYALISTEDGTKEGLYPAYGASMAYEERISSLAASALKTAEALRTRKESADSISMPENPAEAERAGNNFVANIIAAVASIESVGVSLPSDYNTETWAQVYNSYVQAANSGRLDDGDELIVWASLDNVYRAGIEEINSFTSKNAVTLWERAGSYYETAGAAYVSYANSQYENIQRLHDGIIMDDNGTIGMRKPQEALDLIGGVSSQISSDINVLTNSRNTLNGSTYRTATAKSVSALDNAISRLNEISAGLARISESSRNLIRLAQAARERGDSSYNQAQVAFEAEDYERARRMLQEARVAYNESLSYQESADLRAYSDERLASLGDAITRAENEIIVLEVRRMKTEARAEYYNGNFENAEMILNQARDRWLVTNVDEDQEILNLLALVSTALTMNSGRSLSHTSPLYPEMSQTLNLARTYFEEGQRLITSGDRAGGREQLELALKKLQELQLVYPLNQEASLLSLRIQQTLDPQGFETLFANRVASARSSYRNPAQQREAYTALVDLHEINPDYPGLAQLIYDVEIAIGVRQRPVDPAVLARSTSLTSQAQTIVNSAGRDEVQLRQALELVDEAIELNPNNDAAMLLKDRIQISIGGGAAVVLSAEDETMYQQAIQALQRNNIVTANALVEQLLQNPANRRSSKILDLQRQIRALL